MDRTSANGEQVTRTGDEGSDMLFDRLCGVAEKHFPHLVPVLRDARLFRMEPAREERTVTSALADWEPDECCIQNFRLPYKTVAIEDVGSRCERGSSCVVLQCMDESFGRRLNFACLTDCDRLYTGKFTGLPDNVIDPARTGRLVEIHSMSAWDVSGKPRREMLDITAIAQDYKLKSMGYEAVTTANLTRTEIRREVELARQDVAALNANCGKSQCEIAALSLLVINEPAAFIVEEQPLLPKEPKDNGRVRRSDKRTHYIVLKPRAIRTLLQLDDPSESPEAKSKRMPHERRGHFRTLHSEKFRHKRGHVLWVKACWIGPSEATIGRAKYRVILSE